MITLYEVATGEAVITFHPRTVPAFDHMLADARALAAKINADFATRAVGVMFTLFGE